MNEEIVQRLAIAKQYIDQRLDEEPTLEEAAKAAGFSPFHFHRLFRGWLGLTMSAYVRDRRLARAAEAIGTTDGKLIDIGLAHGFEAAEMFSRSFKRKYGLAPGDYRKRRRGGLHDMDIRITERPATRVIGVSVRTDVALDRNIAEAWREFGRLCASIPNVKPGARAFGLELYEEAAQGTRSGAFTYVACIEVEEHAAPPSSMTMLVIPAGRYAVATHKGSTERLQETFGYVYGVWLPASGESLRPWDGVDDAAGFDFELYDGRYRDGDPESELDVYVPLQG
ncbi:AraC family transcriptional regulator [Paenibacillus methanolicus]|uniref:AraC family transcriptional regulator n=1 Tax=Paenibacillus methanolicus TaxID=582686 RepID=A0A5S5CH91_9BACL|nr:AraC family transcriptional regulator [Paenibacillus methanolicus]TYP79159.1 AraC family transcriptional regulator [Paenibacillus methanolicus]